MYQVLTSTARWNFSVLMSEHKGKQILPLPCLIVSVCGQLVSPFPSRWFSIHVEHCARLPDSFWSEIARISSFHFLFWALFLVGENAWLCTCRFVLRRPPVFPHTFPSSHTPSDNIRPPSARFPLDFLCSPFSAATLCTAAVPLQVTTFSTLPFSVLGSAYDSGVSPASTHMSHTRTNTGTIENDTVKESASTDMNPKVVDLP